MDKEKLQQILELKNAQAIDKELIKEGFFDMTKHPTLKKISLVPIAQSKNLIRLDWINDYKYSFQANYVELVEQYPKYEFIWLQINKYNKQLDMGVPHIQRVYAKQKELLLKKNNTPMKGVCNICGKLVDDALYRGITYPYPDYEKNKIQVLCQDCYKKGLKERPIQEKK